MKKELAIFSNSVSVFFPDYLSSKMTPSKKNTHCCVENNMDSSQTMETSVSCSLRRCIDQLDLVGWLDARTTVLRYNKNVH